MRVSHLALDDFRSWKHGVVELPAGPTVLVGANGQGKTNLVEAVEYLSTLGSHRVASDAPLLRAGTEQAIIRAVVVAGAEPFTPRQREDVDRAVRRLPLPARTWSVDDPALPRA